MDDHALRDAAREAFIYALALTEIASMREAMLLRSGVPAGRFYAQCGLATPRDRFVRRSENDSTGHRFRGHEPCGSAKGQVARRYPLG